MSLLRRRREDVAPEPVEEVPVAPVSREEVAQQLQAAAPDRGRELADRLRPAVRWAVRREPDAGIDLGRSKFGGAPDLPHGTFWPSWTPPGGEKQLLQFFAQLDLAEVTGASSVDLGLPADGLLSFFADFDPEKGSVPGPEAVTVLYSPADELLSRMGLRMVPVATAQLHPLSTWSWPASPATASATAALDKEYESALHSRAPEHYQVTTRHQSGGYADGADGTGAVAAAGADSEAFVLLLFDSDPTLDVAWGPDASAARLAWTLPAADLASRNWSGARFSLLP